MNQFYINRRGFLKTASALSAVSVLGKYGYDIIQSLDTLRVGVIGVGWYGKSDVFRLIQVADVNIVAISDVDDHMAENASNLIAQRQKSKKKPLTYKNYRKMLSDHQFDLILIGTPDHWHALNAIDSMQAGAHIYLQKPVSTDVLEGAAILKESQRLGKVIQVGTQRRSTPHLQKAKKEILDAGLLGKVAHVEICSYYHMRFKGNPEPQDLPDHFDYDLWCGPALMRTFDGLPHRRWRAYMEYGNGIMGDMCVHMFDAVRWLLGLGWPKQISSTGGIYVDKKSNANITDTQTAIFEYEELSVVWNHRTWGRPSDADYPWAFKIYGEYGVLKGDVHKYEFEKNDGEVISGDVLYEREKYPMDLVEKGIELHAAPATRAHMLDWLGAIASGGKPIANIEEAFVSSASCIIANLALEVGKPLSFDPEVLKFANLPEADKHLQRDYRGEWQHPKKYL